jgi:hypothetical protein
MEAPLSKVTATIGKQETWVAFEVRIACATNHLAGNYDPAEHHACASQLHHGHLNRIFEFAGVNY